MKAACFWVTIILMLSCLVLFGLALLLGTTALFEYRTASLPPDQAPDSMSLACICFVQGVMLAVVTCYILTSLKICGS